MSDKPVMSAKSIVGETLSLAKKLGATSVVVAVVREGGEWFVAVDGRAVEMSGIIYQAQRIVDDKIRSEASAGVTTEHARKDSSDPSS